MRTLTRTERRAGADPCFDAGLRCANAREIRWSPADIALFLGELYLSRGARCFSNHPRIPSAARFRAHSCAARRRLDAATRLLDDDSQLYVNGMPFRLHKGAQRSQRLANARGSTPGEIPGAPHNLHDDCTAMDPSTSDEPGAASSDTLATLAAQSAAIDD